MLARLDPGGLCGVRKVLMEDVHELSIADLCEHLVEAFTKNPLEAFSHVRERPFGGWGEWASPKFAGAPGAERTWHLASPSSRSSISADHPTPPSNPEPLSTNVCEAAAASRADGEMLVTW